MQQTKSKVNSSSSGHNIIIIPKTTRAISASVVAADLPFQTSSLRVARSCEMLRDTLVVIYYPDQRWLVMDGWVVQSNGDVDRLICRWLRNDRLASLASESCLTWLFQTDSGGIDLSGIPYRKSWPGPSLETVSLPHISPLSWRYGEDQSHAR